MTGQGRHRELLDADGVGRDQREEAEAEQDRAGCRNSDHGDGLRRRRCDGARLDAMVDQVGAIG